jgi:hypothetical protein
MLDAHRLLRRQEKPVAVDRRLEGDSFFADLAQCAERKNLKAARIGENRSVPAHEAVQSTMCGDGLQTRSQPKVEGVAETDLRAAFDQVARGHRLDRSVGADRHEGGGFDDAMGEADAASTGCAVGGEKFEVHEGHQETGGGKPLRVGVKNAGKAFRIKKHRLGARRCVSSAITVARAGALAVARTDADLLRPGTCRCRCAGNRERRLSIG